MELLRYSCTRELYYYGLDYYRHLIASFIVLIGFLGSLRLEHKP